MRYRTQIKHIYWYIHFLLILTIIIVTVQPRIYSQTNQKLNKCTIVMHTVSNYSFVLTEHKFLDICVFAICHPIYHLKWNALKFQLKSLCRGVSFPSLFSPSCLTVKAGAKFEPITWSYSIQMSQWGDVYCWQLLGKLHVSGLRAEGEVALHSAIFVTVSVTRIKKNTFYANVEDECYKQWENKINLTLTY